MAEHLQHQVRIATATSERAFPNSNSDISAKSNTENDHPTDYDVDEANCEPPLQESFDVYEHVLYWLDEYGSMIDNVSYGVHGYASNMLYSILDQKYGTTLSRDEAVQLLNEFIQQLQT